MLVPLIDLCAYLPNSRENCPKAKHLFFVSTFLEFDCCCLTAADSAVSNGFRLEMTSEARWDDDWESGARESRSRGGGPGLQRSCMRVYACNNA